MNPNVLSVVERDESGYYHQVNFQDGKSHTENGGHNTATDVAKKNTAYISDMLVKIFLPAGYPQSVTPGILLLFQVLNACQAFCSSLAGLLSSRAVLEGFGVGDANATATRALLLTILQDVSTRLTTIVGGYWVGSSLYPEAKTYRFVADILIDAAIVLETFLPVFTSPSFPLQIPGLRICILCISSSLRSMCGVSAGGSKAAITLHFATPTSGTGDVGDLNAKDSSKETILALFGMLLGSFIVPHLTTSTSTYGMLFLLVGLHLTINYAGVKGLQLRTLNRQRAAIAWAKYRSGHEQYVLTPAQLSIEERIFESPGMIRDALGQIIGHCTIGSSLSEISRSSAIIPDIDLFSKKKYILLFDSQCLSSSLEPGCTLNRRPLLHICLKEGYGHLDQLEAWIHAAEVCRVVAESHGKPSGTPFDCLEKAYRQVSRRFPHFFDALQSAGWRTSECALLTGPPRGVLTSIESTNGHKSNAKLE
ncbi:DUF647-domain-containing protein [Pluteus cervinus]|uniref:DUF647-domain-containing protein n=1 Tax=Pluteus cervinus TaxID=181527 RepID=A0ACD3AYR8_9AGAR|nr:DUF647-domain-containing protein [Pluteus cervinus]